VSNWKLQTFLWQPSAPYSLSFSHCYMSTAKRFYLNTYFYIGQQTSNIKHIPHKFQCWLSSNPFFSTKRRANFQSLSNVFPVDVEQGNSLHLLTSIWILTRCSTTPSNLPGCQPIWIERANKIRNWKLTYLLLYPSYWIETHTTMYPKITGLAAWSENCKRYSSLPLSAVLSLFYESV
jgi:hypothetical protein